MKDKEEVKEAMNSPLPIKNNPEGEQEMDTKEANSGARGRALAHRGVGGISFNPKLGEVEDDKASRITRVPTGRFTGVE